MSENTGKKNADGLTAAAVLCEVFRSPRREGLYLYVRRERGLAQVPEALLASFGKPESALVFRLSEDRRLARVAASDVLAALEERGYYLQMPPAEASSDAAATDARERQGC